MGLLFHAIKIAEWREAQEAGTLQPASLALQGYVHLSTREQAYRVLNVVFAGDPNVVLLELREENLGEQLVWEPADPDIGAHKSTDELFPHLYRPIELSDVERVWMRDAFEERIELA
jgi:uncharacterized protein (DUF952 family)